MSSEGEPKVTVEAGPEAQQASPNDSVGAALWSNEEIEAAMDSAHAAVDGVDEAKMVPKLATVVEGIRQDEHIEPIRAKWDGLSLEDQRATIQDIGLVQRLIESIPPIALLKFPKNVKAAFFRALLYYGVLQFKAPEGSDVQAARAHNEQVLAEVARRTGGEETLGKALVLVATKLCPEAAWLNKGMDLFVKASSKNRAVAGEVRAELYRRDDARKQGDQPGGMA